MRFFIDKITRLRIGWNERPLTEIDFYHLCKLYKIKVNEMPLSTGGFYYRVKGRDFIAVNSRLSGALKLAVLFHELGHFLFHTPEGGATANFHGLGRRTRKEREADTFALCALIPKPLIENYLNEGSIAGDDFPADLLAARLEIYRRHGI